MHGASPSLLTPFTPREAAAARAHTGSRPVNNRPLLFPKSEPVAAAVPRRSSRSNRIGSNPGGISTEARKTKKFFSLITAFVTLALGTGAFAVVSTNAPFTAGNLVVYRMGVEG